MTYILAHYSKQVVQTYDDDIFSFNEMTHTFTRDMSYCYGYSQKYYLGKGELRFINENQGFYMKLINVA